MMAYAYLLAAIALEIAGTFCLKLSDGFAKPIPTGLTFFFYAVMNVPAIMALKTLPLSLVYPTWAGIGVVAAAAIGIVYFGEQLTATRFAFLTITLVGIVGLQFELAK